jgi:hypothetical protein
VTGDGVAGAVEGAVATGEVVGAEGPLGAGDPVDGDRDGGGCTGATVVSGASVAGGCDTGRVRTVKRELADDALPAPSVVTTRSRTRTLVPHGAPVKRTGDVRSAGCAADHSVHRTPLSTLNDAS